jgi:hypothetical protein
MALKINKPAPSGASTSFTDHLVSEPAKGSVATSKKEDGEYVLHKTEAEEISKPQVFPEKEMLKITINCGKTINLGNYESARVDISITVPTTKDSLEDAYEFATSWVDNKMAEAVEGVK